MSLASVAIVRGDPQFGTIVVQGGTVHRAPVVAQITKSKPMLRFGDAGNAVFEVLA
jgi:hypothetical protein